MLGKNDLDIKLLILCYVLYCVLLFANISSENRMQKGS